MQRKYLNRALLGAGILTLGGMIAIGRPSLAGPNHPDGPGTHGSPGAWGGPGGRWHGGGPGGPGRGRRLERMSQELNLNAQQKSRIQTIMSEGRTQMESLRGNTKLTREQKFAKMRDIMQHQRARIRNVLNSDQKKKFDAMTAKMEARRKEWQKNHPGGPLGGGMGGPGGHHH